MVADARRIPTAMLLGLLAAMPWTAGCDGPEAESPGCGAASYEWLPAAQVGGVLAFEPTDLFAELSSNDIDALLGQAGYTGFSPVAYGVRNYRMRYVTQDRGVLREATAIVGFPVSATPGEQRPIMLWLHGSVGYNDACAPSRDPLEGPAPTTLGAALGYVTVAPDYLGLIGFGDPSPEGAINPYLVAEPTAIASLDAVRAMLAAADENPQPTAGDPSRLVVWGGSQGGHAAWSVDRFAPDYAPELGLLAVAAGTPPVDLVSMAAWALEHGGLAARSLALALVAMREWYGLPADLASALTDVAPTFLASSLPDVMRSSCGRGPLDDAGTPADIFASGFLAAGVAGDFDAAGPWGCFLRQNSLDRMSVPRRSDAPVLVVFGEVDDLVVASTQRAALARLCDDGARVEVRECAGKGHQDSVLAAFPYIHRWTRDRLAGATMTDACRFDAPVDCEGL
jgi:dienelactone hydrolase